MGSQRIGHDRVTEQQNVKRSLTVLVIKRMSIKKKERERENVN